MTKEHQSPHHMPENAPVLARRPWLAAALSALLPGFGQLYNGETNRAAWILLAFILITIPITAVVALYLPVILTTPLLAIGVLTAIAIWLYAIVDGWRRARQLSHYRIKAWQTSSLYVIVFFICSLVLLPSVVNYVRGHVIQAFRIPSNSMAPTLMAGDYLFADMRYNCPGCKGEVQRGDVAIFVYPNNRNRYYIKRVIGLPGDDIAIKDGEVSVNNKALYVESSSTGDVDLVQEAFDDLRWTVQQSDAAESTNFVAVVPNGHVFVLGDNRGKSNDSRVFGMVPLADVAARARQIWFSRGDSGIRWKRLGQSIHNSPDD